MHVYNFPGKEHGPHTGYVFHLLSQAYAVIPAQANYQSMKKLIS